MPSIAIAATGLTPAEEAAFRRKQLSVREREELVKPFLPSEPDSSSENAASKAAARHRRTAQNAKLNKKKKHGYFKSLLFFATYHFIALLFSIFFRFRRAFRLVYTKLISLLRYHHRTPEFIALDVSQLNKLPKHLSVIVELNNDDEQQGNAGLEGLVNDVCEIAAWASSAGITFLSVYERSGVLKNYLPQTHTSIESTLESYFGPTRKPTLSLRAPHLSSYSPPTTPPQTSTNGAHTERQHLTVLLLSEHDGRDTIVDLTRTLAEMAQRGDVRREQINQDLVDAQLSDHVSSEPDLLILFSPTVQLKGYPPWQLRLTEIFHLPDNRGVNYQVFIRALYNYAKVEMRLGR
ncbi:Undecaprenyl diphosphate synthase [Ophiobolus disseminans]|uniref:ditrans,polycis-polyprenyl diphosphate synthase [(2E,6E)-farnesyldiphosphate specific] n=1 Tax=Ophiobolus disseminans TaxID=1469910 RepID=A0A6A7AES9_9PLEO|nr:Undecaprenyl diphosphate synthase [Ophiobolus disseminans]